MRRFTLCLLCVACLFGQTAPQDGRGGRNRPPPNPYPEQGRSVVVSRGGIVASSQTLASQAGVAILDRGGSAIDAAIAANAVLGLAEPVTNGLGGDLLAIVYEAKTK